MELFKLNATHNPGPTFKNFDSLIWTERYQSPGDFQIVVENDISILVAFPLGVLISHTDTTEVMMVENHEIERDKDKKLKVTVTGRSFDTFAENRITAGCLQNLEDVGGNAIVESRVGTPEDVAVLLLSYSLEPGVATAANEIPNLNTRTDMRVAGTSTTQIIKRGSTYSRVLELLNLIDAGIKTVRPNGAQTTLDLVVHDGADLTADVIFQARFEDLRDAKYFWSIKGYENYAHAATKLFNHEYRSLVLGGDVTDLERRLMYVEASDLEGSYVYNSTDQVVVARAQTEMAENFFLSLIQATISETAKPKFKIDYDVGDIVSVFAEFGVSGTMRVTEHILTVDKEGMKGYPALSTVSI